MCFVVEDQQSGAVAAHVMRSRYYAIRLDNLVELMRQAGFGNIKRMDDQSQYPAMLVGTRRG